MAGKKAFRYISGLAYFLVSQAEAVKLLRVKNAENFPKHFEQYELPLKARVNDIHVGFLIGNNLAPYKAANYN